MTTVVQSDVQPGADAEARRLAGEWARHHCGTRC